MSDCALILCHSFPLHCVTASMWRLFKMAAKKVRVHTKKELHMTLVAFGAHFMRSKCDDFTQWTLVQSTQSTNLPQWDIPCCKNEWNVVEMEWKSTFSLLKICLDLDGELFMKSWWTTTIRVSDGEPLESSLKFSQMMHFTEILRWFHSKDCCWVLPQSQCRCSGLKNTCFGVS